MKEQENHVLSNVEQSSISTSTNTNPNLSDIYHSLISEILSINES